jgi:hypothetical protein
MDKNNKPKISDNPSAKEMKDVLPAIKAIGKVSGFLGKIGIKQEEFLKFSEQVKELERQAKILDLPDRFNKLFSSKGWICVGRAMSVEVMEAAIAFAEAGQEEEAEQALVDWFTEDNIRMFAITRARRFHQAHLRDDQLREALKLYLEERYIAAVPLILLACDGLASDVAGVSPFAEKACLGPLKLCQYLLTNGVAKNGTETVFG